ncbi:cold shock domain-containing protein [Candidatus Thioglobus sp.]|jgi:CspA family cold shock protein|uniref:cold-shock protein n=1 Tax=Candidatus Thioglobus sp. TaxID=2026721 RepID=UPI001D4DB651|nr:cold shock domain-containing protein [Candidatus Thioglobus sp.]MBT3276408.1 cold shock domain-containing protein [Candidatus Thioglobus sp.]MBT4315868.1 cold shock domain-containing protein [Candidatus Thioglobus sp.]MBT4747178.1 cold shock domain-containing protein [Candidatus Thioglobus sp.]MBT6022436.1 cold shock domain-containing protein [Candidatus Thioglobus sp.]MBT6279211.1 cold shock domain-containing protein [Candidatus Thioglobus sp.]
MAKKIKGVVAQFGTKGYGFITGDDEEKYFVHQKNIFNKSRLKAGTRVVFKAQESEKGLVASDVELENGSEKVNTSTNTSSGLSAGTIKAALSILFIAQAVVIYKVFFTSVAG